MEAREARTQQSGATQQHQRDRDLGNDQHPTGPLAPRGERVAPGMEIAGEIASRRGEGRHQSEDEGAGHGQRHPER
jgi:hypothetical protein